LTVSPLTIVLSISLLFRSSKNGKQEHYLLMQPKVAAYLVKLSERLLRSINNFGNHRNIIKKVQLRSYE
jgi:hypothetical protein